MTHSTPLDAEMERLIAETDNPRRRDDLVACLDACRDTPETCGFCGGPLSAPEDGSRCSKRCR
jgi:hypothetical protein